jgi:hypothetical protein
LDTIQFLSETVGLGFAGFGEAEGSDVFFSADRGQHWVKAEHLQSRVAACGQFRGAVVRRGHGRGPDSALTVEVLDGSETKPGQTDRVPTSREEGPTGLTTGR